MVYNDGCVGEIQHSLCTVADFEATQQKWEKKEERKTHELRIFVKKKKKFSYRKEEKNNKKKTQQDVAYPLHLTSFHIASISARI